MRQRSILTAAVLGALLLGAVTLQAAQYWVRAWTPDAPLESPCGPQETTLSVAQIGPHDYASPEVGMPILIDLAFVCQGLDWRSPSRIVVRTVTRAGQ